MYMKTPDQRALAGFIHDSVAMLLACLLANWIWLNLQGGSHPAPQGGSLWIVPIQMLVFWRMRLHQVIWRYFGIPDFSRLLKACALSAAICIVIALAVGLPNASGAGGASIVALDSLLLLFLTGTGRLAFRLWKESSHPAGNTTVQKPVLILGAGDAGADLLKHLARSREWRVAGLLDDNAAKHGRQIQGCPVLGSLDSLPQFAMQLSITQAIIGPPRAIARRAASGNGPLHPGRGGGDDSAFLR
jgi:FlaA1/EpsC-like NDP-sugar epimerase